MKKLFSMLFSFCILTGCWNNEELNHNALVHGVGIHRVDDQLHFSMEIIKPSEDSAEGTGGGESIIIEEEADTLIEAARESIRDVKRRLHFDHNLLWIISEELAKDEFVRYLDASRRDQMFRLNEYLFITDGKPVDILKTTTLYDNLSSTDIVSALGQTQYITGYTEVKLYDFYKAMEGPIPNTFVPLIHIKEENNESIISVNGTAVIKDGKMVGKLTSRETNGLNVLLNKALGGYVHLPIDENMISIEIVNSISTIHPILEGDNLKVHIKVKIESTLADNGTMDTINEEWINRTESIYSDYIEEEIYRTLRKLQKELKTDITGIGIETYRKYPDDWNKVKDKWDDIFSSANVTIEVHNELTHHGLINKSLNRYKEKPHKNPYLFQ